MNEPSKLQVWFRLFWIFLKVNLLTTAGPTSIGLLYKETVGKIMTEAQFVRLELQAEEIIDCGKEAHNP